VKIEYNNLYTHFVFTTLNRLPLILEKYRVRIEKYINDNRLCVGIFQWQQSCSAFSVSKRNIHDLCEYIENQKEHHKTQSYTEEYEGYVKFYQQTIRKTTNKQ